MLRGVSAVVLVSASALATLSCSTNRELTSATNPPAAVASASSPAASEGPGAQPATPASVAATKPFRFAWGLPCRVPVEEDDEQHAQQDASTRLRFNLTLTPIEGNRIEVRQDDM